MRTTFTHTVAIRRVYGPADFGQWHKLLSVAWLIAYIAGDEPDGSGFPSPVTYQLRLEPK